jgi:hypothetical protein
MSNLLKEDLLTLKNRLENIETQLEGQMKDLEVREEKWKRMDEQVTEIIKNQNSIVKLNIGGKKFATRTENLLREKDTLFYKMILSKKFENTEEIFFDRSPKLFPYLIDYLRYGKINYKRFNKEELEELRIEADYYEIAPIVNHLEDQLKEIDFIRFESSGVFNSGGTVIGSNKIEDLKDKNLATGILSNSPGWIVIELNAEWEFDQIEVGGYNGNTTLWYPGNGANSQILTSKDKTTWKSVGTLPSTYAATITTVFLTKSVARYIKFQHNNYVGLGYLRIKKS